MRISPTAEWSSFATYMCALVLILTLLALSYVMRVQWFGPKPFMGNIGMPFDYVNPQAPFKSYHLLVRRLTPALDKNFEGIPWLPTIVPKRLGYTHDFSARVFAGQDRFEIQVDAEVPGVSDAVALAYQSGPLPNDVPIFRIVQTAVDRATAVGEVLRMRWAPDEPMFSKVDTIGTIQLDGRVASVFYSPIMDTEDIRWEEGRGDSRSFIASRGSVDHSLQS